MTSRLTNRTMSRRPRSMLITSLVFTTIFALMGVTVAANPESPFTQGLDNAWRSFIGSGPDSGAATWFLPMFFQEMGGIGGFAAMFIIIPIALIVIGRWRSALFVLAAQLVGPGLYSQVMKNLVDRPRPAADEAAGLYGPLFRVDHGSFPSGHAISAAVIVVTIAALLQSARVSVRRAWLVIGVLIAVGMIWQRTLINAHWLSDALTGIIAGTAAALLMWWAFWPWLQKDAAKPLPWRRAQASAAPTSPAHSDALASA